MIIYKKHDNLNQNSKVKYSYNSSIASIIVTRT